MKDPDDMNIEALILRRCYPVPVTFADLRAAANLACINPYPSVMWMEKNGCTTTNCRGIWSTALKQVTDALDEVYAVVDGREVRIGAVPSQGEVTVDGDARQRAIVQDLLDKADHAGYWERPHEVRLDLQERPVSHDEIASAVLIGQAYVESKAVRS